MWRSNIHNNGCDEIYKNNPELAKENQSRPGAQNGRARKIKLFDTVESKEIEFGYMRAAASYLIANGLTKAKSVDSLLGRLSTCAKNGKKYKKRFYVEFVD